MASQIALKSGANNTGVLSFNGTSDITLSLPNESGTLATQAYVDGKMVLATSVTATGTAVDFTGIPSWAKRITVMLEGVSTSGTSPIMVQLGSSGVKTSGYLGTANGVFDGTPTGVNHSSGFLFSKVTAATYLLNGAMTITNKSGNSWVETSTISSSTTSGIAIGSGSVPMSGSVDTIRVTMLNGTDTFDAGTINIMYEG